MPASMCIFKIFGGTVETAIEMCVWNYRVLPNVLERKVGKQNSCISRNHIQLDKCAPPGHVVELNISLLWMKYGKITQVCLDMMTM